jgi:hypothetical protein
VESLAQVMATLGVMAPQLAATQAALAPLGARVEEIAKNQEALGGKVEGMQTEMQTRLNKLESAARSSATPSTGSGPSSGGSDQWMGEGAQSAKRQRSGVDPIFASDPWGKVRLGNPGPSARAASAAGRGSSSAAAPRSEGPTILWVKGFYGLALSAQMRTYFEEEILTRLQGPTKEGLQFKAMGPYNTGFLLETPSAQLGKDIVSQLRDKLPTWTDPSSAETFLPKVVFRPSAGARQTNFMLSKAWKVVHTFAAELPSWQPEGWKLGTNPQKRSVYAFCPKGRMVELFRVTEEEGRLAAVCSASASTLFSDPVLRTIGTDISKKLNE